MKCRGLDLIIEYKHPYYQKNGYRDVKCQNAEKMYEEILSIPIFYKLTEDEQTYVIEQIAGLAKL